MPLSLCQKNMEDTDTSELSMCAGEQRLEKLESWKTEHLTTTQAFTKITMNEAIAKVSFSGTHLLSLARKAFCS